MLTVWMMGGFYSSVSPQEQNEIKYEVSLKRKTVGEDASGGFREVNELLD